MKYSPVPLLLILWCPLGVIYVKQKHTVKEFVYYVKYYKTQVHTGIYDFTFKKVFKYNRKVNYSFTSYSNA